nr:Hypothetical protein FSTVLC9_473 [Faustovirus]
MQLPEITPIIQEGNAKLIRVNRHGVEQKIGKIPFGYYNGTMLFSYHELMLLTKQNADQPKKTLEQFESLVDLEKGKHWCRWEMEARIGGRHGRPGYLVTRKGIDKILNFFNMTVSMRRNGLKYKIGKIVNKCVVEQKDDFVVDFELNLDLADDYESEEEEPIVARPMRNQWRRLRRNDDVAEEPMQRAHRVATHSRAPIIISEESDVAEERIPMDYRSSDEDDEYDFDDGFVVPDDVI